MRGLLLLLLLLVSMPSFATIIGYFPGWAAYRDETTLLDAKVRELEVLVYNSAFLQADGTIAPSDPFSELSIEQITDQGEVVRGNFNAVRHLKATHSNLKVVLSVGGWNGSKHISSVLADPEKVETMLTSWQRLKTQFGFDGLELDWQHPLDGGAPDNSNHPNDLQHLLSFSQTFRQQCEQCTLMLTLGAGSHVREGWPLPALSEVVDLFVLHASSFNGSWSQNTGHMAPLYANTARPTLSIDRAVQQLIGSGLPNEQLVLQLNTVGTIWQGVASSNNGLFQSASQDKAFGTWDNEFTGATGTIAYREVAQKALQPNWQAFWDEQAKASYLYNRADGQFISYESKQSLAYKLAYTEQYNLAGIGFWDIEGDATQGLVYAAYRYWQPWQGLIWRLLDHFALLQLFYLSAIAILLTAFLSRYYWQHYQQIRIEVIFHQQWHIWLQQVPQQLAALSYLVNDSKPEALTLPAPVTNSPAQLAQQLDAMVDDPWQRLSHLADELVDPWQADELAEQLGRFLASDNRFEQTEVIQQADMLALSAQQFSLDVGDQHVLVISSRAPMDDELQRYLQQLQSMVKVARVNASRLLAQPQLLSELSQIACRRDKVRFIKAEKGYSGIYSDDLKRPEFITTRLRYLAIHFPNLFIAPHRSYLVVLNRIEGVCRQNGKFYLVLGEDLIPIARGQVSDLKQRYPAWFETQTNASEQAA